MIFTCGVTFQTSAEKLDAIPVILREAVESQQHTRFDRAHFKEYGAFSLVFETVYFVASAEFNVYMDIQQAINLYVLRRFAREGIELAYPRPYDYPAREGLATGPARRAVGCRGEGAPWNSDVTA